MTDITEKNRRAVADAYAAAADAARAAYARAYAAIDAARGV